MYNLYDIHMHIAKARTQHTFNRMWHNSSICHTSHTNMPCNKKAITTRHMWQCHIICECVMSHMNESCHIWMSHVTYHKSKYYWQGLQSVKRVVCKGLCSMNESWLMSHMDEACHIWISCVTYEWVMSHMNESCRIWMSRVTYEWVVAHVNESCHIWMSHVTYEWVVSHMNIT